MKTVDSNFTDERDKQHPAKAKTRITLQTYDLSGNEITDEKYDLTDSLVYLPEIKSELEDQMNANKASSLSLEFYDSDDTIWDYFGSGDRRWAIKVEQTYDTPNPTAADNISSDTDPYTIDFSPNGKYLFVGHQGGNDKLQKFAVDTEGNLTFDSEVNTTEDFAEIKVTNDYIYTAKIGGWFRIYDHDLTLIGSVDCTAGSHRLQNITISSDENHAWATTSGGSADDNVYYIDISTKSSPSKSTAISSIDSNLILYWNDYLYVCDYANDQLKTYDASTPASVPYSLSDTLSIGITAYKIILDDDRSILYLSGIATDDDIIVVDISNADDPALTTTLEDMGNWVERSGIFLFIAEHNGSTNTVVTTLDTINHYKLESYGTSTITTGGANAGFTFNGDNILAIADYTNDKIYTASIWQNWVTLFEGIIDYQSLKKIGRNRTNFTAYTGEKELETYNAEQVYDSSASDYLRNITGVTVTGLTGGTTGAKKLEYTYKTLIEDSTTIDEFGLIYEGGEEYLFRVAGDYDLTGSSGQVITLSISDTDDLPRKDAEDTLVVGDTEDYTTIGYWYESEEIATIVGYLWDESDFTISTQNTDIDTSITALVEALQFYYADKVAITDGDYHSCIEDNPPDSDNIIWACGVDVFNIAYDSSTREFTGNSILDITDTFASATRVDKILRLPNGNSLVVCVSGTKGAVSWSDLEGVMEIQDDGTIDNSWDSAFLSQVGVNLADSIAGSSVELINYTRASGQVENRSGFYWMQFRATLAPNTYYFYISFVDIDDDPASIADTTQIYTSLASADPWVAPNAVYHRTWVPSLGPSGGNYSCWFLRADNGGGYIDKVTTGGASDVEESLTYCSETTINTVRAIRADSSQNRFYLITSKMASDKQYVLKCIATGTGSTSVNTDPVDYILDYAAFLPDLERATAFEMDSSENAQNLVMINWGTGTNDPTITNLVTGFMGHTYTPNSVCYLDDDETYAGTSEVGAIAESRFFIATSLSAFIVPIADFTDMNVRQALDKMAEAYVCLWNRPELDTANFISRENYVDSFTLEKDLYLPQYQITKQPPYLAVEAKNTYYEGRVYLARYPDSYMGDRGDMLQIDNRFITPINKEAIALVYYNFYNTIRRIFEVSAYYLIELELFDKIVMTLYDISGNSTETINTVLMEKSFDNATKTTRLRLVELDATSFVDTIGGLWLRRKVC